MSSLFWLQRNRKANLLRVSDGGENVVFFCYAKCSVCRVRTHNPTQLAMNVTLVGGIRTHIAQPFSMLQCDLLSACFCFHNSLFCISFRFVRFIVNTKSSSGDNKSTKSTEGPHTDTHLNLA